MVNNSNINTTKQKILLCAAGLFAEKGFTETTTRELAEAVGLNQATLYYHFPSKNAILDQMLEDYSLLNTDIFQTRDIAGILRENPTTDGVMSCFQLVFPPDQLEYSVKVLCVLLQEQLRNPMIRSYVSEQIIFNAEESAMKIIDVLKEIGAIHKDTDADYWMKLHSSIVYSFASRFMLGIGDGEPGFTGRNMTDMLISTYDMLFEKHGIADSKATPDAGG
jgi:AcrR family transcriptional regulator